MLQASGWRAQNPRKSPTVAEAAEMACDALTLLVAAFRWPPPLGSSNSTTLSQNAKRNRKNIARTPLAVSPAYAQT
jgi:hypothetical protein